VCILAFFISRVITLFVWAKLEKRGEERRGGVTKWHVVA
jgi:hypothetical protein